MTFSMPNLTSSQPVQADDPGLRAVRAVEAALTKDERTVLLDNVAHLNVPGVEVADTLMRLFDSDYGQTWTEAAYTTFATDLGTALTERDQHPESMLALLVGYAVLARAIIAWQEPTKTSVVALIDAALATLGQE